MLSVINETVGISHLLMLDDLRSFYSVYGFFFFPSLFLLLPTSSGGCWLWLSCWSYMNTSVENVYLWSFVFFIRGQNVCFCPRSEYKNSPRSYWMTPQSTAGPWITLLCGSEKKLCLPHFVLFKLCCKYLEERLFLHLALNADILKLCTL